MAAYDIGIGESGGNGGAVHVIQANDSEVVDEISPLLSEKGVMHPRINIFSVSSTRKRPAKERTLTVVEVEVNFLSQILMWVWGGSKYSGLLCMASSSTIYYIMEVLIYIFPGETIPLFESVFTRCTIILLLSILWLRKVGHPVVAPTHARNLLVLRSLCGCLSLLSFIYSVKNLPLSYAICLNLATPIVASIGAKIILQEKLALSDIGEPIEMNNAVSINGEQTVYAVLLGLFSSLLGGICYCLIQAAAKASGHPMYTVFSFGLLASPMSAFCTLALQEFVLPNLFTLFLMVVLSVLAFLAEISLARGLQLEKISKAANMIYVQVILSLAWNMSYMGISASFNKLLGGLLILGSLGSTLYFGPEREPTMAS